jgi:hypothetical protein
MAAVIRQDYVLGIIEQFARTLSGLLSRILGRQLQAADLRAELTAIASQAGLDLDVAQGLDEGMLLVWLAPLGELDPGRFWLMAELLFLDGLQARADGEGNRARGDFHRVQAILARLEDDWRPQPDLASVAERRADVERILAEWEV